MNQNQESRSSTDKSLFYYGSLYNKIFDPLIRPARNVIVERIPAESSVLDIGCGTGLLCFDLRRHKNCKVIGIDLSQKMLEYAKSRNPFDDVGFLHQNATDLRNLDENSFDYVVILNIIHELVPEDQIKMLQESFRVGRNIILFDANVPLPWNVVGVVKRLIEITFGIDHFPQFRSFISAGGIIGILEASGYSSKIVERSELSQGSNLLVQIAK